jgi:hypothetical protein
MKSALKWVGLFAVAVIAVLLLAPHNVDAATLHPHKLIPYVLGIVTPATLTDLNDLAKDYFSEVYVPLMNVDTPLKNQLEKLTDATFTGRQWIFGVKLQVGGGASNAGANKSLPPSSVGKYDQGSANVVRTYVRLALDGLVMEVTKMKAGSYRPAVAEEMSDRLQAHDLEVNRQCFCNADGKLAMVNAAVASATQSLDRDYGRTTGGDGCRHVYEGDMLAFYQTNGTLIGRKTVVTVNRAVSPNTVVLDSSITTVANTDFVSKSTPDTDNFTDGEANGLLKITTNAAGNFEAIPTAGRWQATRDQNGGTPRDISDPLVVKVIETIRQQSKQVPNLAVCSAGIPLKYSELFLPIRRIDGQDTQLKGGYKPLSYIQHGGGEIPVLADNDSPKSTLWFLNTSALRWADLVGTEWFDMDGAVFTRITDKDGAEGFVRKYWQLITIQRNALGVIEDLNDYNTIDRVA